jgi:hypothetical protein
MRFKRQLHADLFHRFRQCFEAFNRPLPLLVGGDERALPGVLPVGNRLVGIEQRAAESVAERAAETLLDLRVKLACVFDFTFALAGVIAG